MKIYPWMLKHTFLEYLQKDKGGAIAKYMEYPKKYITKGVIQYHLRGRGIKDLTDQEKRALAKASYNDIVKPTGLVKSAIDKTRGCSLHEDWRFKVDNYLVGWSWVGLEWPKKLGPVPGKENIGYRVETKCYSDICNEWQYELISVNEDGTIDIRYLNIEELTNKTIDELARQPTPWLNVKGYVPPGKVGAGRIEAGFFIIKAKLDVVFGSQKPYFHEYFIKGGPFKDWTRVIIRGVKVPRIDPRTKKPIPGKYEYMWRGMLPSDQMPYALSKRARKKGWVPPKGVEPIPPNWKDTKEYKEWKEWVTEEWKKKPKGTEKMSKRVPFVLHLISAKGQFVIRGMPNIEWYLRIDTKSPKGIRSWYVDGDPTREYPLGAMYVGTIPKKLFNYEGMLKADDPHNPFAYRKIPAKVSIIDKGTVEYESTGIPEVISLNFKGKVLTGKWRLVQEEKKSDMYTLEKLSKEELYRTEFVLHIHEVPAGSGDKHYDIRILKDNYLDEFNLYDNPITVELDVPIFSVRKKCYDVKDWFIKQGKGIRRRVGRILTTIDVLDSGTVEVIEDTDMFMSLVFNGKKLKGYYIAKKTHEGWEFIKSRLPKTELTTGDPITGEYYRPFIVEKKKGWDYYWIHIYDIKNFTRCVSEADARELYLAGISIPKQVLEISVCLAPRKGTLPLARVAAIRVSDEWDKDTAFRWIRENALHTWSRTMIRKERKALNSHGNNNNELGGICCE